MALIVLAAFSGLNVAQEEKKRPEEQPATIPYADRLTLSATKNVLSKTGCSVTARPGYLGNPNFIDPNYHSVNFEKWVSNNWVALTPNPSMVTNSQGVAPRTVPWNTKIRAWSDGKRTFEPGGVPHD